MKSNKHKGNIRFVWVVYLAMVTAISPICVEGSFDSETQKSDQDYQVKKYGVKFYQVRFTVKDGIGHPVEGALVRGTYPDLAKPQTYGSDEGITDVNGHVTLSVKADMGVFIDAMKEGYYRYGHIPGRYVEIARKDIWDGMDYSITMRRVLDPIPLYARLVNVGDSNGGRIPIKGEWVGFDFEIGDWVKPYGAGETTDIQFRFYQKLIENPDLVGLSDEEKTQAFETYRRRKGIPFSKEGLQGYLAYWEDFYDVSFSGEKEGIVQIEDEFIADCLMSMPQLAPVTGYKCTLENLTGIAFGKSGRFDDDVGYFIRTRVILDANGEIVSANYAKIRGGIDFGRQGRLRYLYYFNPNENDRNLEFDVGKNLTDKTERETYSISFP